MQDSKQDQVHLSSRLSICSNVNVNEDIGIDLHKVNKPLREMSFKEIICILKVILGSTCSVCIGLLLQMLILSINLHFVGKLADPIYLDAIGFSIIIINCTGGFFIMGLNQGAGSYIGKAHGKNDKNMIYNYFFKGLFSLILIFIFFIVVVFNSRQILLLVGQEEELSIETQKYSSQILPGIFANFCFDLVRNYLNGQEIYIAPMVILSIAIPFHYFMCDMLFETYEVLATVYSTNLTYILILIASIIYLKYKNKVPIQITIQDLFKNYKDYFIQCSIIALPMFIDILGFEINSVLVGLLGDLKQFGAHVAVCNYTGILFSFPIGMGGAFMLLTSNAVGKNCLQSVKNLIRISQFLSVTMGCIFATFQISSRVFISKLYSQDEEIQEYFQQIAFIYGCFVTLDFISQTNLGILKAIGKAKGALYAFIIAYYIVGLPASAILGLGTNLQLIGFWYGFAISVLLITFISTILLNKLNIEQQVKILYDNLEQQQKLLLNQEIEMNSIQQKN